MNAAVLVRPLQAQHRNKMSKFELLKVNELIKSRRYAEKLERELVEKIKYCKKLKNSTSWKITNPLGFLCWRPKKMLAQKKKGRGAKT